MSGCQKCLLNSLERWNLIWWSIDVHNQSLMPHIFVPHYSFHLALWLASPSHSPFPVTISHPLGLSNEFRKMSPPKVASNSLLNQVVIAYHWGLGSITRLQSTQVENSTPVWPFSKWSNSGCYAILHPDKVCSPPKLHDVLSQMIWSLGL